MYVSIAGTAGAGLVAIFMLAGKVRYYKFMQHT
jgi:hypothetical protein